MRGGVWLPILLVFMYLSPSAAPKPECTPHVTYRIEARLDPLSRTIHGTETLTWENYAPDPVHALPFHLYMNAFRNRDTTFMREGGERGLRGILFKMDHPGYCRILSLVIDGRGDLTRTLHYVQPDDGNTADHTVIELPLAPAVLPGGRVTIHIRFETRLPRIVARAGWEDHFFMVAQWFPKIGVLEPPGWRGAVVTRWNCHQYHRNSEFYANFGDYDVTVTVPADYIVGATGELISSDPVPGKQQTVMRFRQRCIHDFAWAASPDFVEVTDRFSGREDVSAGEYRQWSKILDIPVARLQLPDVNIRILMHREHTAFIPLSIRTLKTAIRECGLMYGPYPYAQITLVDPAPGAFAAAGMEYPTLFTAGTHNILSYPPFPALHFESVITHEFAHNYWYGMVATNEFEEPWLDEGLTSFTESAILRRTFGSDRPPLDLFALSSFMTHRSDYISHLPLKDPLDTPAWEFYPGDYEVNCYSRVALTLLTLQNLMGYDRFHQTLRSFFQTYRFTHPDTGDFIDHFARAGGLPVRRFLEQTILSAGDVDYSVSRIETAQPAPGGKGILSRAWLVREGTITLPVDVEFRFRNGRTVRRHWDGQSHWTQLEVTSSAELESVQIDPDHQIPLDRNLANNSRTIRPGNSVMEKSSGIFQFLIQSLFHLVTLIG